MSQPITDDELAIVNAIYEKGGKRAAELRAKCNWEHMSPVAVIREWPSFAKGVKIPKQSKVKKKAEKVIKKVKPVDPSLRLHNHPVMESELEVPYGHVIIDLNVFLELVKIHGNYVRQD